MPSPPPYHIPGQEPPEKKTDYVGKDDGVAVPITEPDPTPPPDEPSPPSGGGGGGGYSGGGSGRPPAGSPVEPVDEEPSDVVGVVGKPKPSGPPRPPVGAVSYIGMGREDVMPPTGEVSDSGLVVIRQPDRVEHRYYASRVSDVETSRGIRLETTSPMFTPLERAEESASVRLQRDVSGFEAEYGPQAQVFIQSRFDELMGDKARELGMIWQDTPDGGRWVATHPSQIEGLREYESVAREQAIGEGEAWYYEHWGEFDIEHRAEDIYNEVYGGLGYVAVKKDGGLQLVPRQQYEADIEKEHIRSRMRGEYGLDQYLSEFGRFWFSGFTPENLLYSKTIGEVLFGEEKGKGERILSDYAGSVFRTEQALKERGPLGVFARSYEPGGFGFIGTAVALFTGGIKAVGAAAGALEGTATGAALSGFSKAAPLVMAGLFSGVTGAELGSSLAYEHKGHVPPGTTAMKAWERGTQFAVAIGLGVMAQGSMDIFPKAKVHVVESGGFIAAKKYLFEFPKGTPRFYIGKAAGVVKPGFEPDITSYAGKQLGIGDITYTPGKAGFGFPKYDIVESIPKEFSLVPIERSLPMKYPGGFSFGSLIVSRTPMGVDVGSVFFKPSFVMGEIKGFDKVVSFDKTPKGLRKPLSYNELFPSKFYPDITKHEGYPFEPTHTTDPMKWLEKQADAGLVKVTTGNIKDAYGLASKPMFVEPFDEPFGKQILFGESHAPFELTVAKKMLAHGPESVKDTPLYKVFLHEAIHLAEPGFEEETVLRHSGIDPFKTSDLYESDYKFKLETDPHLKAVSDWLKQKTALSTEVFPKPVLHRAYEMLGFGKITVTPYTSMVGPSFMVKLETVPVPKRSPLIPKEAKPYVRAIDRAGRQVGHSFVDLDKPVVLKEGKPVWRPVEDTGRIPSKQIHFERTEMDVGDVLRTPKELRKNFLSKEVTGKGVLPEYDNYKGYLLEKPVLGKSVILRPTSALSLPFKGIPLAYYVFMGVAPVKPVESPIVGFRGFKGKTYSLKDLTKKWEMEKSDVDKGVIRIGGGRQQQVVLEKPKTKKIEVEKPVVETVDAVDKSSSSMGKVSNDWLRKIGRFDLDDYIRSGIGMGKTVSPKRSPMVLPLLSSGREKQVSISDIEELQSGVSVNDLMFDVESVLGFETGFKQDQVILTGLEPVLDQVLFQPQVQDVGLGVSPVSVLDVKYEAVFEEPSMLMSPAVAKIMRDITGEQAYVAKVKKRQYVNGRRIRGTEWEAVDKHPYRRMDALALMSDRLDNTARRTGKLVPVEGKPHRLRRKVKPWGIQMFEYDAKGNDVFVEKNLFAIDSEGEVDEISRLGWEARKRGKGSSKSQRKSSSFGRENSRVQKEVNRLVRKAFGV